MPSSALKARSGNEPYISLYKGCNFQVYLSKHKLSLYYVTVWNTWGNLAPAEGFEPPTQWLTATR